jgi:hypothetical protein
MSAIISTRNKGVAGGIYRIEVHLPSHLCGSTEVNIHDRQFSFSVHELCISDIDLNTLIMTSLRTVPRCGGMEQPPDPFRLDVGSREYSETPFVAHFPVGIIVPGATGVGHEI